MFQDSEHDTMDPFNDPPRPAPTPPGRSSSRTSVQLTDLGAQPYGADPQASIRSTTTVNDPFDDHEREQAGYHSNYHEEESIPLTDA